MLTEIGIFIFVGAVILFLISHASNKAEIEGLEQQINHLKDDMNVFFVRNAYYRNQIDKVIPEKVRDLHISQRVLKDRVDKIDQNLKNQKLYTLNTRVKQLENRRYRSK